METHEQDVQLQAIFSDFPDIRITCVPPVAARGDTVRVIISNVENLKDKAKLILELISSEDGGREPIELNIEGESVEFVVPTDHPEGEYSLQLRRENWVLDSIPFEIAQFEYARESSSFAKGLQLRVRALDEIKAGHYEKAVELAQEVEGYYEAASSTDIAARAWQDIGSSLLQVNQLGKSQAAFNRAFDLYTGINDPKGQASSLFLLGQTYSRAFEVNEALVIFDRARTIADSCQADFIGLKSRAALWHLSSGSGEALRRHYCRDLISYSCTAKSTRTRHEALSLYTESVPLALLNKLWSFDNSYLSGENMHFECTLLPRHLAFQNRYLAPSESWPDSVRTPWEGILAVFTSTLLTTLVLSISAFIQRVAETHIEFKIRTTRDQSTEGFHLSFTQPSERDILKEAIQIYLSFDDFKYYEALTKAAGGSLVATTEGQVNFIKMEMPLVPDARIIDQLPGTQK